MKQIVLSLTEQVDAQCNELFSCSTFAGDEYGSVFGGSHSFHQLCYTFDGMTGADHGRVVMLSQLFADQVKGPPCLPQLLRYLYKSSGSL